MEVNFKKANADHQPEEITYLGRDGYYFNYNIERRIVEDEERLTYDYDYLHVKQEVKEAIREMGLAEEFDLRKSEETLVNELYNYLKSEVLNEG